MQRNAFILFLTFVFTFSIISVVFADVQDNASVANNGVPVALTAGLYCRTITNNGAANAYIPIDYSDSWNAFVEANSPPSGIVIGSCTTTWYLDADGDGYMPEAPRVQVGSPGAGWSTTSKTAGDCDDASAGIYLGIQRTRYSTTTPACGSSCAAVSETQTCQATSTWSGSFGQSSCSEPTTPTWYKDSDSDGYMPEAARVQCASPGAGWSNTVKTAGDCDDGNGGIYLGITRTRYSTANPSCGTACADVDEIQTCQATSTWSGSFGQSSCSEPSTPTWYKDSDSDGYMPEAARVQCASPGAGWSNTVKTAGDCDDGNGGIYLGVQRTRYQTLGVACGTACNSETQTCQASSAWSGSYGDTSCTASTRTGYTSSTVACGGSCTQQGQTCQTNGAWSGTGIGSCSVDPATKYTDGDSDGYGTGAANQCSGANVGGDCDDGNGAINPGATDVCGDGVDNNCNGQQVTAGTCAATEWTVPTSQFEHDYPYWCFDGYSVTYGWNIVFNSYANAAAYSGQCDGVRNGGPCYGYLAGGYPTGYVSGFMGAAYECDSAGTITDNSYVSCACPTGS